MHVRRLCGAAIAFTEKRHVRTLMQEPWAFFGLGDRRRSRDDRKALLRSFRTKPSCCHPHGMARSLTSSPLTEEELTCPTMEPIWILVAGFIGMSIGCVERLHARNRATAHSQMSFANFCANFTNSEVKECETRRRVHEQPAYLCILWRSSAPFCVECVLECVLGGAFVCVLG